MDNKKIDFEKNIHALGVSYICDFLDHSGFTIHEVNTDPNHHFQLLAKVIDRKLLIAVRTAFYPDIGTIDKTTKELLINEAKQLNSIPHFSGLTVIPLETNDIEADGSTEGPEYKVIFSGISVVRELESLAVNE